MLFKKRSSLLNTLKRYDTFERDMLEQHIRDLKEENEELHKLLDDTADKIKTLKDTFDEEDIYTTFLEEENASLKVENEKLRSEIAKMKSEQGEHNSSTASSSSSSDREPTYLMEAANGMTVRVPESKLDDWIKAQKELMESHTRSASEKKMHDDIVREFFGDES